MLVTQKIFYIPALQDYIITDERMNGQGLPL